MKQFCLIVGVLLTHQVASAQTFFSVQWDVAEPTEEFRRAAKTGYGVQGTYMHFITPRIALSGSAGYTKWGPRIDAPPNDEYKFVSVPVQLGAKFLLSRGVVAPFVGISVGANYVRLRGVAPNDSVYADQSELKFGFSPKIGTAVFVAGPVGVLLTGSYNVIFTVDTPSRYFGLSAGLVIGF